MIDFRRQLKLGATGRDCVAVKRALARAGFGKLSSSATKRPVFGPFAVKNLKRFQQREGIPASGVYGPVTHRMLVGWFDAYSRYLYGQRTTRERIVDAARYFVSIKDRVHYTLGAQRMTIVREELKIPLAPGKRIYEDCSSWVTGLYWIAGAPDPNGRGYDGFGYTGTLKQHGRRVPLWQAKPGDLVFYGRPEDVKVYIGKLRVIGNGSEAGPLEASFYWRWSFQEIRAYL